MKNVSQPSVSMSRFPVIWECMGYNQQDIFYGHPSANRFGGKNVARICSNISEAPRTGYLISDEVVLTVASVLHSAHALRATLTYCRYTDFAFESLDGGRRGSWFSVAILFACKYMCLLLNFV